MASPSPTMNALFLDKADGVASIPDAHYLLFPGAMGDQVTAVSLTLAAAMPEGTLSFQAPEGSTDCALGLDLCNYIIACFPHTEAIVGSLHEEEPDSDSDEDEPKPHGAAAKLSAAAAAAAPAKLKVCGGTLTEDHGRTVFVCKFSGVHVGDKLKIFFALRHPLLGPLRVPIVAGTVAELFTAGAVLITANTNKDGGRNPQETLYNLKRTFATGTLSRIVEPTRTLADISGLLPSFLAAIDVLRSRKYLNMYLSESHTIPLE